MKRNGFTLIELLVAIVVIGILSGLMLGALQKANTRGKVMKTQATIAKIHQQVMTKWESYKYRRLPIDPNLILAMPPAIAPPQRTQFVGFITKLWVNRGSKVNDPLNPVSLTGSTISPTTAQVAAARLAAVRELQRYEMPTGWADVVETDSAGNWVLTGSPPLAQVRTPTFLLTPPGIAQAYVQKINQSLAKSNPPSVQQLQLYDAAECLYLIVKLACEEENVDLGNSLREVGDADGDGMFEFQDAFSGMDRTFATTAPANNPIMWNRWPAGYNNLNNADSSGNLIDSIHVSDYQDDPLHMIEQQTGGQGKNLQVVSGPNAALTFAADNHDYFDTLKLDMPLSVGGVTQASGYQLTPLIYSAGIDSTFGIVPLGSASGSNNNPYLPDAAGNCNAQWYDPATLKPYPGVMDNITNHVTNAQ